MVLSVLLLLLALGVTAAFVAFGDALLTLLLRKFAGAYVGERILVFWSLRDGVLEINNIALAKSVLPALEPLAGKPVDLEKLEMQQFVIELPLIDRFLMPSKWAKGKTAMASRIHIAGLQVAISLNHAEKWIWTREDNLERFQQAVKDAAKARLARVDAWTTAIVQKLKELTAARDAVRAMKQARAKKTPIPPKPIAKAAFWHALVDEIIDSFAIVVRRFSVTIRDEYSASGMGVSFEKFEIGRSTESDTRRKRIVQLQEFEIFVNPQSRPHTDACYVVRPFSMEIGVFMPHVYQGLLKQIGDQPRALELEVAFSSDLPFAMQLRPAQISFLMSMLNPLQFYNDWCNRTSIQDEISCVELDDDESREYMELFKEQWTLDNETAFAKRMYTNYKNKQAISARRARLADLEATTLATRLLDLRARALAWKIPRGGAPLPHIAEDVLRRGNLRNFLQNPLEKYEKDLPEVAPMFHRATVSLIMNEMKMQLLEDTDKSMMAFFVNDLKLEVMYSMAKVALTEHAMVVGMDITRFGLLDERNVPTNVFPQLMDRNPDAVSMLSMHVVQHGSGHMDVALELKKFSLLVVFDPLISTMNVLLPALSQDEETQMRFLAYDTLTGPQSPEQREVAAPLYRENLPQEYSPLLLGGMSLNCKVLLQAVEICLLGDSSSLKSHVLAFTSDAKLQVVSSTRHEVIELELVDVALQPCRIILREDGIDLDLAGLRTILELEGEGVDLELAYRLTVGDSSPNSSARLTAGSEHAHNKSGSQLWGIARAAASKKNIVEVTHTELQKAEEIAVHSVKRDRVKSGARRKVIMRMSDFALNLSPNDLGVFLSILGSLNDSMVEDKQVIKQRDELQHRITRKKKEFEEKRYKEHLKSEFKLRDVDGGGSLDVSEIESLLRGLANCQNLTKDEFDDTVREFITIVDSDGSGDISLEEFESALNRNKIIYPRLHQGVVSLTGQEYVDPRMQRNQVPYLKGENAGSLSNAAALSAFWSRYQEQVGASKIALNGMMPIVVQKKMVRAFKNYDYAQEAWYRLVNPSLIKFGEQSVWLLTKEMDMGSRGNVIDQLLSSFDAESQAVTTASSAAPELRMFVHTVISTAFGGFYFRLMDDMLPLGLPALEVSLEELAIYGNFSMWEGEAATSSIDVRAHKRAKNNYGVGKLSFDVYGKYYNSKVRSVEPFLEFYQGVLDVKKDPESHTDIVYSSDKYLQLNITSAFMEALNSTSASFSKVDRQAERQRSHIKEEDGIFWMLNETGVNLKYFVVAKKETKEKIRVETVTAVVSVPSGEAHPCMLLNVDEEMKDYEQQSLKEKQLRQAFRNADQDGSGELDTEEVRTVLREIFEEEEKQRSARGSGSLRHSESTISEHDLNEVVEDFVALADTDQSGLVSWEEFKIAISKMRETVDRYLSIEIEGFKSLHDVSIVSSRDVQVFELVPHFQDVESETSIASLYTQGVELLNKIGTPSRRELQRAYACLHRVKEMDPSYEWIDSYYIECMRVYLPVLVAIDITADGLYGLQVKVSSAENIRNDTAKLTECLLVDDNREVSRHNPNQRDGKERFCTLPPHGSLSIPIDLVDAGSFAIRQVGETEWSNFLPLSVREQRLYKQLTHFEQREAQKAQLNNGSTSITATKLVSEKLGKDIMLPNPNEYVDAGTEVVYPSLSCIDNQPTAVAEKISANNMHLGTWSLVIQPQLVLHNVLPCGIEYAIVQTGDCPKDSLDSKGEFRVADGGSSASKHGKAVKSLGQVDYFEFVNEVNSRRMFVESGKSIQIFGLDLEKPAIMKMRLCASASNRAGSWSTPFFVGLGDDRAVFSSEIFELRFDEGPGIVYQQEWQVNAARTINLFAPYWIQNRSGLDLKFKCSKGTICTAEQHRIYFNGDRTIPMLANAPIPKAMLSVKPYQETPRQYESDMLTSPKTKKYLPKFEKVDWSEPKDMASVGTNGELRPSGSSDYSFVLAYEVRAAPAQFFRSKILIISPRYMIINRVPRPLQVTPVLMDKKLRGSKIKDAAEPRVNCSLKQDETVVVYTFTGKEKHWTGLRIRDYARDGGARAAGDWSSNIPVKAADQAPKTNNDYNFWTRGHLGDGPIVNVSIHSAEEIIFVTLKDVSATPPYRIENRSTQHSFRYIQRGVRDAEELILKPLESHSFVWDDPLAEDLELKIVPTQWKVPTVVDFMRIGEITNMTPTDLHGEVYIDGATRVLAIGDTKVYADVRQLAFLNDWLSDLLIDMAIHGVGITIVDDHPQEVLNITMENLRFASSAGSRSCVFTLHHIQMDDMSPQSPYPVVLAPLDSGFNSDKREGWLPSEDERPFFSLTVETSPQSGIVIVNNFDMEVNSLVVNLSLEYVIMLRNVFFKFIAESDEETLRKQGIDYKNSILTLEIVLPDVNQQAGMLLYFKKWRMSGYDFHLVFDSVQEDRGEGISAIVGSTLGSILGGIAHVTPEFHFNEIVYRNTFFYEYDLMYDVIWKIVIAVVGQWYKIVGSVEMLGDPVGLATEIVDGFALAARQLKRDMRGTSLRKGESAITLAQTVVGAPFGSLGKVSNGLGDVVKKVTSFKSQESSEEPRHVPAGLYQSGVVFTKSIAYGVTGFVKEPVRGAKRDGFKGFAKGVGRGTMQLLVSPVVGTLGVVEKFAQSVSNTTHLMDEKHFDGGRRPARDLVTNHLKPLSDSNVITEVEVHCLYIDGLPDNVNSQVVVCVNQGSSGGGPARVERYKSTTFRRTGTPKFDQSWLIGITSLDTTIDVNVYHKRKPMPKKLLGYVRFSIEDVYREFEAVPAKLLSDTKAKMRLKRRKRVRGSIISELASASDTPVEVRDDSWKQRIRQTSSSILSGSAAEDNDMDSDDDSDSYEDDVEMLSSRSITVSETYLPTPMEFELLGGDVKGAKIFLSIRYVNDLRRYA